MTTLAELDAKVERLKIESNVLYLQCVAARQKEYEAKVAHNALCDQLSAKDSEYHRATREVQELETAIARGRVIG